MSKYYNPYIQLKDTIPSEIRYKKKQVSQQILTHGKSKIMSGENDRWGNHRKYNNFESIVFD